MIGGPVISSYGMEGAWIIVDWNDFLWFDEEAANIGYLAAVDRGCRVDGSSTAEKERNAQCHVNIHKAG